LRDKKIDVDKDNYITIVKIMNNIIDNNIEIINNIREIYCIVSHEKLRRLIEKHFIPTNEEKKKNAEIPTPVVLVDEMLNIIPKEFWTTPKKVFEPCCGKSNFVLGIFDKFYNGLSKLYKDEAERCQVIMTECLYYGDLTTLNVFITTEILKCHVQSYTGLDTLDYKFNSYTGDTLKMDVEKHFKLVGFDAVIGNPPYNSSGATGTGNTIWQEFTKEALNEWIIPNGYLLFVHPPGWRKPSTIRGKYLNMFELMTKQNQLLYLEIHGIKDGKITFNCGTRYDWYLIEKNKRYKNTVITDEEHEKNEFDLRDMKWIPNFNINGFKNVLVAGYEMCPIIYDRTSYGSDKKQRMSSEFKYTCIHTTPKTGIRYMYSNVNDKRTFWNFKSDIWR
jgi:Eco57I restriction-modification methylase